MNYVRRELRLTETLSDPMVRAAMKADGVDPKAPECRAARHRASDRARPVPRAALAAGMAPDAW